MRPVLAIIVGLAACQPAVVELGVDAPIDSPAVVIDATTCRCRIPMCRDAGDCTTIGGGCEIGSFFCVGDFGPCTVDAECQGTVATAICTMATDSTASCR